jgi:hypothetical protein
LVGIPKERPVYDFERPNQLDRSRKRIVRAWFDSDGISGAWYPFHEAGNVPRPDIVLHPNRRVAILANATMIL